MPRQTAAQKLAAQEAAAAEANGPPPEAPVEPVKTGPVLADYTLFGLVAPDPATESYWVPLGEVKAPTHVAGMELAKDRMRDRILGQATEEAPAPATLKITVAAIASRNWNQGTAIIESRPVTTWEK